MIGRPGVACVALLVGALTACKAAAPTIAANLLEGQGAVTRDHQGHTGAAPIGQPFVMGDAVHTGADAWARLELRGGPVARLGQDTTVRFVAGGARLDTGSVTAETQSITILTEAGAAIIEAGGVLQARGDGNGFRFDVVVGRAVISRDDGPITLDAGGHLQVAIGGAIIEPTTVAAQTPTTPTTPPVAGAITATVRGKGASARTGAETARPLAAGRWRGDGSGRRHGKTSQGCEHRAGPRRRQRDRRRTCRIDDRRTA